MIFNTVIQKLTFKFSADIFLCDSNIIYSKFITLYFLNDKSHYVEYNRNYRTVRAISRVSWQENYLCFSEVKILAVVSFLCVNVQPHQASRLEFSSNLLESRFSKVTNWLKRKTSLSKSISNQHQKKWIGDSFDWNVFLNVFFFSLYKWHLLVTWYWISMK